VNVPQIRDYKDPVLQKVRLTFAEERVTDPGAGSVSCLDRIAIEGPNPPPSLEIERDGEWVNHSADLELTDIEAGDDEWYILFVGVVDLRVTEVDAQTVECLSQISNIRATLDISHSGEKSFDAEDASKSASVLPVLKDADGVRDDVKLVPTSTPNPSLSNNALRQGGSILGTTSGSNPVPAGNVAAASNQPDLKLSGLSVRGKGVNSGSDCDPGKNTIEVQVENGGSALADDFRVRLLVDGSEVDSEKIDKLDPGKKESVGFKDVELRSGQRTIKVVADSGASVAESSESNNELQMQVSCAAD
jgi:hypothetical protein